MMEKVLLVGKLSELVRSLNECLTNNYQVQLCSEQLENVQALVRITKPELIIICHIGIEDISRSVYEWIHEKHPLIPVLGITTNETWKQCRELYQKGQFSVLFRPISKEKLLNTCHEILHSGSIVEARKQSVKKEQRRKIMIVDDSALLLRNMKSMLEKYYNICLAKSGEQALRMIPEEYPDLILLDYEMDGMDGKSTFEAIKENKDMQIIPVVFLTSIAQKDSIYSVLKLKPDGYILKPPDEKRILETIEEILGGK